MRHRSWTQLRLPTTRQPVRFIQMDARMDRRRLKATAVGVGAQLSAHLPPPHPRTRIQFQNECICVRRTHTCTHTPHTDGLPRLTHSLRIADAQPTRGPLGSFSRLLPYCCSFLAWSKKYACKSHRARLYACMSNQVLGSDPHLCRPATAGVHSLPAVRACGNDFGLMSASIFG